MADLSVRPQRNTISLNLPSLRARADDIELSTNAQCYPLHVHKEMEFLYVTCGEVDVALGESKATLYAGDIIFINSLSPHRTTTTVKGSRCKLVQFGLEHYLGVRNGESQQPFFPMIMGNHISEHRIFRKSDDAADEVKTLVERINEEFVDKKQSYECYITAYIHMMIAFLSRNQILPDYQRMLSCPLPPKIETALHYIAQHYQENLSLDTLCHMLDIDKYYFCKIFKSATSYTFTEYLNCLRIRKAESLLSNTTKSISEIAFEVGFSSVSYFNRAYRKVRPYPPSFYRKFREFPTAHPL